MHNFLYIVCQQWCQTKSEVDHSMFKNLQQEHFMMNTVCQLNSKQNRFALVLLSNHKSFSALIKSQKAEI